MAARRPTTSTAYPPPRLGQQRVHRHHQRVATLPVVIVTVTGAWFSLPAAFGWVSDTSTVIVAGVPELPSPEPEPGLSSRVLGAAEPSRSCPMTTSWPRG